MILNWIITRYQWLRHVQKKRDFIIRDTSRRHTPIHLDFHKFDSTLNKGFFSTRNDFCKERRGIKKLYIVFIGLTHKIKVSQRNWLTFFGIPSIVCNGATTPNYRSLKLRCKVSKPLSRNFQQLFFPGAVMKTFRISFPGT